MHGIIRRSSSFNTQRIDHIYRDRHESAVRLKLHYGDLTDSTNLMHIIYEVCVRARARVCVMCVAYISRSIRAVRAVT